MRQCMLRRSMLFIPGNKPKMLQKAGVLGADAVIFDLEDSVNPEDKDEARRMVASAIEGLNLSNTEIIVRVNLPHNLWGMRDIHDITRMRPQALMIPKANEESLKAADEMITQIECKEDISSGSIKLFPLIETAYGVENIQSIIKSTFRITGVLFGAEDFTLDMRISRTESGDEIFYARSRIAVSCRACGVDAIDTPYTNLENEQGLIADIRRAKHLGMTGKAAIHPKQIKIIHKEYTPSEEELKYAERVLEAQTRTNNAGGVFCFEGRMIDLPIVERAERIVYLAKLSGLR